MVAHRLLNQQTENRDSRLANRLHQHLGVLEGNSLILELVVEVSQCFLFTDGILAIKIRLLLITI